MESYKKSIFTFKKKRELLGSINKRKMSLRKNLDNYKQNECTLDITQITKCVFLGSLCLKPVPQLFESPLELDMKIGNIRKEFLNNENEVLIDENLANKEAEKKCLKKNSLRERNDSKSLNDRVIKTETVTSNDDVSDSEMYQKFEPREPNLTAFDNNNSLSKSAANFEEVMVAEQDYGDLNLEMKVNNRNAPNEAVLEYIPPDIKSLNCPLDYEDLERIKREPTPEIVLTDSDEDAIDQLMFNISDIKVGPNFFGKDFLEMQSARVDESYPEYSPEFVEVESHQTKHKKFIKRTPQCKICSQIFPSYIQLKKHKTTHKGDKPYLCVKCNEQHTTLDQLIAHLRTHQGKRPYVCKKCNKGFKTVKALENHQPVHVLKKACPQKKSFKCEVCEKEFRKLCDLERHTRVHTGEKPSVCNICNKRFQQAHNLNKHLLIHTQEKPFQCDICNKKFGRNDVLNRHVLTHSVDKPNHCDICRKSFIRVSQLLAHKEKYHANQNS